MSHPIFIAKGTHGSGTGSSVNFSYPGGIQQRDLLFLQVCSVGMGVITADGSWTQLVNGVFPTIPVAGWKMYWKLADGSESGSEAVTRSGHSGSDSFMAQVYQFRSPIGIPIVESSAYQTTGGTSATITWSAVTVGGSNRTLIAFAINHGASGTPTGYTEVATDNNGTIWFDCNVWEDVSSDGSVTASGGSATGWTALHVCIFSRPAARFYIVN